MPQAISTTKSKAQSRFSGFQLTALYILPIGILINLFMIGISFAQEPGETKNILYINSYHPGYSWSDAIQDGLIQGLHSSDLNIELSVEYLDSRRFANPELPDKLSEILLIKYSGYRFDLVVVSDNAAFDFAVANRNRLFPGIPIVFCGYNNFRPEVLKGLTNISGVNEEVDIKSLIETALQIEPGTRTLAFILSTGDVSSRSIAKQVETNIVPAFRDRFQVVIIKDASMTRIRESLARLPSRSALFLMGQTSDMGEGRALSPAENGRLIAAASPVPAYTLWNFHLNTGVLGGRILNGVDQGRAAADIALQILNGKSADAIPVLMTSPTQNIFDYNAMKRFSVAQESLPENSTVINMPVSFYAANKRVVGIALSVFAVLIAFIIVLCVNILMRMRAEKELQKHRDQLEKIVEERTAELTASNTLLAESQERFRCLSDAAFEGIVFSQDGRIIDVNNTCCEMFGYFSSEVIGKAATDFVCPEERENVKSKMMSGFPEPYASSGLKKDGQTFPIEIQGKMFSYKGSQVRVSAIRDLTKQKQAEEEIKTLRGILPICLFCKRIRDDQGYWEQVDIYIRKYSQANVSHGVCPECVKIHYPQQYEAIMKKKTNRPDK